MPKTPALRTEKQIELAREYLQGQELSPDLRPSYAEIAKRHSVQPHHVRYAVRKMQGGTLGAPDLRVRNRTAAHIDKVRQSETTGEIIERLVHEAAAELTLAKMEPKEKITLLQRLAATKKELLAAVVAAQIKNPEADRVIRMMRLVNPTLTDQEIVELWHNSKE